MSKATTALLDELHGAHADVLLQTLKNYKEGAIRDEDGNAVAAPPAFLAQVCKFLKDNGIDRPASDQDTVDILAGEMPDFDDFENVSKIGV